MPLKIRFSPDEGVLRSVDDTPGILTIHGDHRTDSGELVPTWGVSPSWEIPSGVDPAIEKAVIVESGGRAMVGFEPLETNALVDAIDDLATLGALLDSTRMSFVVMVQETAQHQAAWCMWNTHATWGHDLYHAIIRRAHELED